MTARRALWGSLGLTLLASLAHVAAAFGALEALGPPAWLAAVGPFTAVLAAVAVDLGLGATVWSIGERARRGETARVFWIAAAILTCVSAFGNVDHALGVVGHGQDAAAAWAAMGAYGRVRVGLLSAALPLVVVVLSAALETLAHTEAPAPKLGAHVGRDDDTRGTPRQKKSRPTSGAQVADAASAHASGRPRAARSGRAPSDGERRALRAAAHGAPDATIAELARTVGAPRQTVSRWVGELERAGELERTAGGWKVASRD